LEQSFVERERFRLLNHDPAEISMPRVEEVIPFLTNNGGADLQNGQGSLSSHASPKSACGEVCQTPIHAKIGFEEDSDIIRECCRYANVARRKILPGHVDQVFEHSQGDALGHINHPPPR